MLRFRAPLIARKFKVALHPSTLQSNRQNRGHLKYIRTVYYYDQSQHNQDTRLTHNCPLYILLTTVQFSVVALI